MSPFVARFQHPHLRARVLTAAILFMVSNGAISQARGGLADLLQLPAAVQPALATTKSVRSCESFLNTRLSEGAIVRDAVIVRGDSSTHAWCRVTVQVTVPSSSRLITAWVGLPIDHWNGRFLGLGGGGWVAGFPAALHEGTSRGFATAITNAGRPYDLSTSAEELGWKSDFLFAANGRLDWIALQNFAYRGIHEMTMVGKAITDQFYGIKPKYAYFSGCSTGGRQGQSEVQRFPADYDGVLSGAPAINWAHFAAAESWHRAVAKAHRTVAQCKFDAAYRAAVEACDVDDGARDGLIAAVNACRYPAERLVGLQTSCGVIEKEDAEVIGLLWDGPRRRDDSLLWNGIDRAALIHPPLVALGDGAKSPFGETSIADPNSLSLAAFEIQFDEFVERYAVMDTASPDLREFAEAGGKTLIWHGVADDIIPAAGSVHYVDAIRRLSGIREADRFLRFYLAPGVGHCGGGVGPQPVGLLEALMDWVESGRAPKALRSENWNDAGKTTRTHPLCPYPSQARYRGRGSVDDVSSFRCQQ